MIPVYRRALRKVHPKMSDNPRQRKKQRLKAMTSDLEVNHGMNLKPFFGEVLISSYPLKFTLTSDTATRPYLKIDMT